MCAVLRAVVRAGGEGYVVRHVGVHEDDEGAARELDAVEVGRAQAQLARSRLQHLPCAWCGRAPKGKVSSQATGLPACLQSRVEPGALIEG